MGTPPQSTERQYSLRKRFDTWPTWTNQAGLLAAFWKTTSFYGAAWTRMEVSGNATRTRLYVDDTMEKCRLKVRRLFLHFLLPILKHLYLTCIGALVGVGREDHPLPFLPLFNFNLTDSQRVIMWH